MKPRSGRLGLILVVIMVIISRGAVALACDSFATGLKGLLNSNGLIHHSKACLICDQMLEWNDDGFITKKRLKSLQNRLSGEGPIFESLHPDIKPYYTYKRDGAEPWMSGMFLSPRGVYIADSGFNCCQTCCKCLGTETKPIRVRLPRFAIANGKIIGGAPKELTDLNDVEFSLISQARTDKRVFTFYGGAHKSMRGWHNMYENDVGHIAGALQQLKQFGAGKLVACILQGPFTSYQLKKVKEHVMIRPELVLKALRWLKQNNILYKDIEIPRPEDLPKPFVIDDSELVQSENTVIESRFEYTVVFPGTEDINSTNGGNMSQEEFRREVIDSMDTTNSATFISRPTQNRLKDYEGDVLLRAFPLQFPYGYGLDPISKNSSTSKDDSKIKLEYIFHLKQLSIRYMQRGDFLLVLHNMYARQRVVSLAYLRCIHKVGDESIAEQFANMTYAQLQSAINRAQSHLPTGDSTTTQLLRSIDAVCKNMGHSNDAAKSARLKLFANTVRFGQGSIFVTVTPDDGNCFRISVYVLGESQDPPTTMDDLDAIDADFEMTVQMRQEYPGFCAFDFDQITQLMIEHVLGWDQELQQPKPGGGAFGILDAWSDSIEEQGRKTLHGHWILWIREWSSLLRRLRSSNQGTRKKASAELKWYIDTVLSTKLFGGTSSVIKMAYKHKCKSTPEQKQPLPTICNNQNIRNLRYQHGESDFGGDNFLKCPDCGTVFNMDTLVDNVLIEWFGSADNLEKKLKLAVKRYSAQLDDPISAEMKVKRDFMIHAMNNLHASSHVRSCFKKGFECRNKLPDRPCEDTTIHFDEENHITWWTWNGTKERRAPFFAEPSRHPFDIFMNRYHSRLSAVLGCNTNVQCGIDGAHIMYATYYSSKGTQTEDKLAYCQVAKTLYARMRRQDEAETDPDVSMDTVRGPTPFSEGYRRLLSAVLSHTQAQVISAPMAWFIMRRGSRFLFSNEFAYVCLAGILGRGQVTSRVMVNKEGTFLDNKINDYVFRSKELENVNLYDFVEQFDVTNKSKKNEADIIEFLDDHPQSGFRGVINRSINVTPLVSYLDFPDASEFEGDILDPNLTPTVHTESYAKSALCLFVPFRDANQFTAGAHENETSFTHQLRTAMQAGTINATTKVRLQNIQDCRNMMKAGRQKDMLERTTDPLPDPVKGKNQKDEKTEAEVAIHIQDCLTEIMSQLDEDSNLSPQTDNGVDPLQFVSLTQLRGSDKDQHGYKCITPTTVDDTDCVFELATNEIPENNDSATTPHVVTIHDKIVSKGDLTRLSIQSIKRNVQHISQLDHINPNGTVESIQKWARIAFYTKETDSIDETQQRAFEVIMATFVRTFHDEADRNDAMGVTGTVDPHNRHRYVRLRKQLKQLAGMRNEKQLIMFLTGAGGSGKTRVINSVLAYAKGFCKTLDYVFDKQMIVVTAMSGVAATLIKGETVHSAVHLMKNKVDVKHMKEWIGTRMIIIDEISFASSADVLNLNEKLGRLKQVTRERYGGIHVIFTGDFSQLEPVSGTPLYNEPNFAPWHDWINCFIELTGQHRFKNDPEFGRVLKRIREGCPTPEDIAYLNTRIINGDHPHSPTMADVPDNVAYAVYRNLDRVAINNGIFAEHIKRTHSTDKSAPVPRHTLIVRSDDMSWTSNKKSFSAGAKHTVWTECRDTDVITADAKNKKYVDPFLKLYNGIPLMYTENTDVPNGIANGTLCHLVHVKLHKNVTNDDFHMMNIDGVWVRTVDASNVDYLLCKFAETDELSETERTFKVYTDTAKCKIDMPIELIPGMKTRHTVHANVTRFPVLPNNCTTGHKLQGQTKESVFIAAWHYGRNWPYVVLSRVTKLSGLFLRTELDPNHDFTLHPRLIRMLNHLRRQAPIPYEPE